MIRFASVASLTLMVALTACFIPWETRWEPIPSALEGLSAEDVILVRYCPCDESGDYRVLPEELWVEVFDRIAALEPDPEGEPGPWDLLGRLEIAFAEPRTLTVNIYHWPRRFGERVFITAGLDQSKVAYGFAKGDEFFAWYSEQISCLGLDRSEQREHPETELHDHNASPS